MHIINLCHFFNRPLEQAGTICLRSLSSWFNATCQICPLPQPSACHSSFKAAHQSLH